MSELGDVYRTAAERIVTDMNENSCCAVCAAMGMDISKTDAVKEAVKYAELFMPPYELHYSGINWGDDWGIDRKRCRVLALCFAAAMADAGDL